MRIHIEKSEIVKSAIRLSEYIGSKGGDYEKIRAIKYDTPQLMPWVEQALTETGDVLNRLLKDVVSDNDRIVFELSDTVTRGDEVKASIVRYCSTSVVVNWLGLVLPAAASTWEIQRQRELSELVNLAYFRKMPK